MSRRSKPRRTSKSYWRAHPSGHSHHNIVSERRNPLPSPSYFGDDELGELGEYAGDFSWLDDEPIPEEFRVVVEVARQIKAEQAALPRPWLGEAPRNLPGDMFTRPAWWYEAIEQRSQRWSRMLHEAYPDFDSLPVDTAQKIIEGWH